MKHFLRRVVKSLRYGGRARYCPVCRTGSRRFLRFGVSAREDACCPFCGSLERHRLFWLYVERETSLASKPPRRALHIAPEAILEKKLRPLIGEGYLTADLLDPAVDVRMDITAIDFPDQSFDFIYCSHVLEHVPDDRRAMREFYRVLTSDGVAVLLVPITAEITDEDPSLTDPAERLRRFGQEDHVRRYGLDYVNRLEDAGFAVQRVDREDFLTPDEIERMGITATAGPLFLCRRSPASGQPS